MKERRLGKFRVAHAFADLENIAMRRLMERVVVLRADYDYCADRFEYTALCEDFAPCDPGQEIPLYDVICEGNPLRVRFC